MQQYNFNSGPSVLPKEVFEKAAAAILDFNGTGLSILETGHRTPLFQAVMDEARALVKELMFLDDNHEVLFLHGGASTQFMQVPMNLLSPDATACYTDTGVFAAKSIKEARLFGQVDVIASSKDKNYTYLPKQFTATKNAAYLHLTTNNTIYGTQWQDLSLFYETGLPLVADMSSDIMSRVIDFNAFDLIYAGAQKNVGAAGVNLVVVNKNILGKVQRAIPTMMDYQQLVEAGSMLNTPPVFAVYVCLLTLQWLKAQGGVAAIEKLNRAKAALFYETVDSLPVFRATVAKEDRSMMNGVFVIDDPAIEKEFLTTCTNNGIVGIKGHRSVGGFRASMYNAMPLEGVQVLTELMRDFAFKKG